MGHNLSRLNDQHYFDPFATQRMCGANSHQLVEPAPRSKSKRPEGPGGLKSHKQDNKGQDKKRSEKAAAGGLKPQEKHNKARDTSPTGSVRSNASTDSLHRVAAGPGDDRKPSKNYENPERRLQLWVEAGAESENRQEAVERIKQAKSQRSKVANLCDLGLKSLPSQLGMLNEAMALWLSRNNLTSLPSVIERLASLTVLEVADNKLGFGSRFGGVPAEIGRLTNLEVLNLRGNKLSTLPASIGNLSKLMELDVSENQLESLPSELANLGQLEKLSAQVNKLSQVPGAMGVMSQLRSLDLSKNQLWSLPDSWGRLLPEATTSLSERLRELNLADNQLQQLPASFHKPQKKLILNVTNNPMESLPPNYGGFTYADLPFGKDPDHTLTNQNMSVRVYTRDTKVRQGLVDEGRLAPGRGVYAFGPLMRAQDRRPPKPMNFEFDRDSIYSVEDYIEEHREEGGIQNIGAVGAGAGMPMAIPRVAPEWAEQRADAWVGAQADAYGYRNLPEPPMPPMESVPQWDTALPSTFRSAPQAMPAGPSFASGPQIAQPTLQPQFLETMLAQLQQLPPPAQASITAYMESLPPQQLVAELLKMQNEASQNAYGLNAFAPAPLAPYAAQHNPMTMTANVYSAGGVGANLFGLSHPNGGVGPSTGLVPNPMASSTQWSAPPPWAKQAAEPENKGLFGRIKSVLGVFE